MALGSLAFSRGGINLIFWLAAGNSCHPECALLSKTAVLENPRVDYLRNVGMGGFEFETCCMEERESSRIKY